MENILKQAWIIAFSFSSIHGFILAFILWFKKNNSHLFNKPLTYLVLLIGVILMNYTFGMIGIYDIFPHLRYTNILLWLLFGPLFYYYFHSIIAISRKFKWIDLLHFIPFFIGIIILFPYLELNAEEKTAIANGEKEHVISYVNYMFILYLYTFQNIVYVVISYRMTRKFEKIRKADHSSSELSHIEWLNSLLLLLVIFLFIDLTIGYSMMQLKINAQNYYNASVLIISLFIYFIGYKMLTQSSQFFNFISESQTTEEPNKKYKNSNISSQEIEVLRNKLEETMLISKPYLNDELRLADLANKLNITTHLLSQVINQCYQKNFYQFINHYRMEEVLKQLKSNQSQIQTISSIAFEAGFSSQASFYRVFKQSTGMTPSKYLKTKSVA